MAVTASLLTSGNSTTIEQATYATASVDPGDNNLLLVAIDHRSLSTPVSIASLSGNGLTWVKIDDYTYDDVGEQGMTSLWRSMGASPSAGAVTITPGDLETTRLHWDVIEFANVDTGGTHGSGAIVQSAKARHLTGGVTAMSVTLAAFGSADNATYGCFAGAGMASSTPGTGFTELSDDTTTTANGTTSLMSEWKATSATTVDATANTGTKWSGVAVEIKFVSDFLTQNLSAAITPAATIVRETARAFAGSLSPAATLGTAFAGGPATFTETFSAAITPAASFSEVDTALIAAALTARITFRSSPRSREFAASLSSLGTLTQIYDPAPPAGQGFWATPFMARPASGPLNLTSNAAVAAVASSGAGTAGNPYLIFNRSFNTLGANIVPIRLQNVTAHTTVLACDSQNCAQGMVYAVNCSNINVGWCRYKNITGPHARVNITRANFVQFNNVSGGRIYNNKGREGDTEDIVSIFASDNIMVEDNHFEGTNWTSPAGSGIALGDVGGSLSTARRNILINPGQVGTFIAGGTNCKIIDNIIYQGQRPNSNVAIYVWNQSTPGTCSGHEVSGNRVWWKNAAGAFNNFYNPGTGQPGSNCGPVDQSPPNTFQDVTIDPSALSVVL